MFICEIWLFHWYFPQFCNLICRNKDISKCFRGSTRLRDNESRLYFKIKNVFEKYSVQSVAPDAVCFSCGCLITCHRTLTFTGFVPSCNIGTREMGLQCL